MKRIVFCLGLLFVTLSSVAEDHAAKIRAMETEYATANGVKLAYKRLGDQQDPVVLMVMGLGGSHILWGDQLPELLVDAGYQVVLFDNRDVGASQRFEDAGQPVIWWEFLKIQLGFDVNAAYDLNDMADDSLALLDELGIDKAHIVGASMGGMIAQVLVARHPERSLSLTSIMSTPGFGDHLPPPGEMGGFSDAPEGETEAQTNARLNAFGFYPDAVPRQLMAILKAGDRSEQVKTIHVPTLVLHGKDDTLIPVAHGEYTAEIISGSRFVAYDGMGHNLPPEVMPLLVKDMVFHFKQKVANEQASL